MSYAEMALATPVAADPTEKNQRATSWPPPISANPPYVPGSRLSARAFWAVDVSAVRFVIVCLSTSHRRHRRGPAIRLAAVAVEGRLPPPAAVAAWNQTHA